MSEQNIDTLEGDALNRAVAEALGWRVEQVAILKKGGHVWLSDPHWHYNPAIAGHKRCWCIRPPDGDTDGYYTYEQGKCFDTPEDGWRHLLRQLDYAHDLNAALALPLTDITITGLMRPDGGWHVELAGMYYASDDNPATAVSRAWLKYQRAQAAHEQHLDHLDDLQGRGL